MTDTAEMLVSGGEICEIGPKLVALDTRRGPELDTITAVRKEMGKIYRLTRRGKLRPEVGAKLSFMLMNIAKVMETELIANRVADIQRQLQVEP